MRRRYIVGATYGHCGCGKGIEVKIPILAENLTHAIKRAEMMGGLKKAFNNFWLAEEIKTDNEYRSAKVRWCRFKKQMREKELVRKMRRRAG